LPSNGGALALQISTLAVGTVASVYHTALVALFGLWCGQQTSWPGYDFLRLAIAVAVYAIRWQLACGQFFNFV